MSEKANKSANDHESASSSSGYTNKHRANKKKFQKDFFFSKIRAKIGLFSLRRNSTGSAVEQGKIIPFWEV